MKKSIEHILEGRRGGFQELISAVRDPHPPVLQQEGVALRLASGLYDGITGPLKSFTPIISISGQIRQGKRVQFTATPGYWTLLYIANGKACINQESVDKYCLVIFEKANDEIILTAEEDTQILFLSAEPISEPVAAKDNFVMNTQEEIVQAFADYNNGIFGTLPY
jgi:redox-sensitive bicupin YhaK (pirin superfamily)